MSCYPYLAIRINFLFPDGDGPFQRIYGKPACFKGRIPVRRRYSDHHRHLANGQYPGSMMDDDMQNRPALHYFRCYLLHLSNGHWHIGFKFQPHYRASPGCIAHRTYEHINAAAFRRHHLADAGIHIYRLVI